MSNLRVHRQRALLRVQPCDPVLAQPFDAAGEVDLVAHALGVVGHVRVVEAGEGRGVRRRGRVRGKSGGAWKGRSKGSRQKGGGSGHMWRLSARSHGDAGEKIATSVDSMMMMMLLHTQLQ